MQPGSDFQPSFYGFVETRNDTMIVIQACLQGRLHFVQRRATPSERPFVAQSGHVFVYEVKASGIQRWTDGVHWSPSRVLGEFWIYAERPASPGRSQTAETEYEPMSTKDAVPHRHKELYGPLAKSFNFKAGELVKKTISIKESGNSGTIWHVVSYYRSLDVLQDLLRTPSMDQHCGRQIQPIEGGSIPQESPSNDHHVIIQNSPSSIFDQWVIPRAAKLSVPLNWPTLGEYGDYHGMGHRELIPIDTHVPGSEKYPWHSSQLADGAWHPNQGPCGQRYAMLKTEEVQQETQESASWSYGRTVFDAYQARHGAHNDQPMADFGL